MLTAHQRIALSRIGFRGEDREIGTPGSFEAIWPHPATAWPVEWHGGTEPDERDDLDPIEVEEVRFIVIPSRPPSEQVRLCATQWDSDDLLFWVPHLDEEAEAAQERLQAFCDALS